MVIDWVAPGGDRRDISQVHDMLYAATADAFGAVFITADEVLLRRLSRLGWVQRPAK